MDIFVMETSREEKPVAKVAKRLRNRIIFIEKTSKENEPMLAKRSRTENLDPQESKGEDNFKQLTPSLLLEPQNEKQQIIEGLEDLRASKLKLHAQIAEKDARIQQFEDRLRELTGPLPDEILLKIFGYLTNFDLLRNVARVSKKFKKLSEDPFLIRKIELHHLGLVDTSGGRCTNAQIKGFLKVLEMSQNLKFFSFDLNWKFAYKNFRQYKEFLRVLPTFSHRHLEEFCIKSDDRLDADQEAQASLIRKFMKYLENCPNLKILKIEFTETKHDRDDYYFDEDEPPYYREFEWLDDEVIFARSFRNLEELHLNGFGLPHPRVFRNIFNMFEGRLPKLRRFCLELDEIDKIGKYAAYDRILQKFASEQNVKIEIKGTPIWEPNFQAKCFQVAQSSSGFKIFNPMPRRTVIVPKLK